ncbi:hypothetical protein RB195_003359 [Necator americanus]|uniref:LIM zinc-binding domain-containing protein n=1 Tax=Necator americanus TaxID=51031 RepID=A0ABR1DPK5_NECAM
MTWMFDLIGGPSSSVIKPAQLPPLIAAFHDLPISIPVEDHREMQRTITSSSSEDAWDSVPRCNRCRQHFHDGEFYVVLEGTAWHQECFRCAQCLLPISLDDDYFEMDGRYYCRHDFNVLYAPICAKCNSFVFGKVMRSANNSFHPECFTCENCEGSLDYGVWCVNGRMSCYNCKEMSPKSRHYVCMKCRQSIVEEDLLRIDNYFFHAYHFSCADCKTALTGAARQLEKEWFCARCFDLRCEICAGCHKPIDKENERSTLALGKYFHVEHFRCAKCDVAFMGTKHYEWNGKAYCKEDMMMLCGEFCYRCNRFLTATSINILGKKWCVDCYRCLSCDRVLKHSEHIFNLDMRPMCKKCFRRKDFRQYLKEETHH